MSRKIKESKTKKKSNKTKNTLYNKVVGTFDAKHNVVHLNDNTQVKVTENRPVNSGAAYNAPAGHKDQVEVVITGYDRQIPIGYISSVLHRNIEAQVALVEYKNGNYYLQPLGNKCETNILIKPGRLNGAMDGSYVTFLSAGKDEYGTLEVFVKDVFAHKNDANAFVTSIAVKYGLQTEFSKATLNECESVATEVSAKEIEGRVDARSEMTITIDGSDTKDRDDAIRLAILDNGNYQLAVDIADVSHYVKEDSALDKDASIRGTSCYAGGQVIPMLPKKLSNGICSLNERVDRLALSCVMEFEPNGHLASYRLEESVINCNYNMTYNEISQIFAGDTEVMEKYSDAVPMILNMRQLAKVLWRKAEKRGALEFSGKEAKLIINAEGKLESIVGRERNEATMLIEIFMLAANTTVAKDLVLSKIPCVFRIHEVPDDEKVENLFGILEELGYSYDFYDDNPWKVFQGILKAIDGKMDEDYITELLKRTQKKAKYSDVNVGHFGLAEEYYCHFTSPIRRYPDLDVHRAVKARIKNDREKIGKYEAIFEKDAVSSSRAEIKADTVEREVEKMYKCRYMQERIGEEYFGKVSNVTKNGIFVELSNTIEGFVVLGNRCFFNESKMTIESKGRFYRLGQKVKVRVVSANEYMQTIDFEIAEESDNDSE